MSSTGEKCKKETGSNAQSLTCKEEALFSKAPLS
jgi:hypothetical protein